MQQTKLRQLKIRDSEELKIGQVRIILALMQRSRIQDAKQVIVLFIKPFSILHFANQFYFKKNKGTSTTFSFVNFAIVTLLKQRAFSKLNFVKVQSTLPI